MNDFRYALRMLVKNPGFAVVAILTLALGIGANAAIFSVVNGVLLRPLPFQDPDRLVRVETTTPDDRSGSHSAPDFEDLQRENASLEALAGYRPALFTAAARTGEPVQLDGAFVTIDFFDVLRVPASLGRTFSREGDFTRGERLVVLSERAWQQLYGTSAAAVGQTLRIDGQPHTLIGVVPDRAEWPEGVRAWVLSADDVPPSPVEAESEDAAREIRYFDAIARLRKDVTLEAAGRDMDRMAAILQERRTNATQPRGIRLEPLREEIVGDVRFGLLVLQAAVGCVLLIACANVSSLIIARATGRQHELAIRSAIGAGRGRLVRQLLAESTLLGAIGGVCGLLLGSWLIVMLVAILPDGVPRTVEITLDRTVALVTLGTALLTGVIFGVTPALQASRADAGVALKGSGGRTSSGRARARAVLVVAQVALTLMLLAGAGLLLNSFLRLQRVESGMRPENVTVTGLFLPQARYPTPAAQTEVYRRIIEGLSERSAIQAAGVGFPGPLRGSDASGEFFIEGRSTVPADAAFAHFGSVSGGYFQAMGIPLIAGRTFTESDTGDAAEVAIASATLARTYWPGESALGKRIRFDSNAEAQWRVIVGIVGDVRQLGLDHEPPPILYLPYRQFPLPFTNVAVRSAAPRSAVAALVRTQLLQVDPDLPPGEIVTLQHVLDKSVAQPRFRTLLIGAFAIVAVVLAAVGLFGLISYSVSQRTREIGIRVALGAHPRQVLGAIMREGLTLTGLGIGIGIVGALLFARVLASFLFGVAATDPLTFAAVAAVLLGVALLATYIPARRALRIDPITALRE